MTKLFRNVGMITLLSVVSFAVGFTTTSLLPEIEDALSPYPVYVGGAAIGCGLLSLFLLLLGFVHLMLKLEGD